MKLNIRRIGEVTVIDIAGQITLGEECIVLGNAVRQQITAGDKKVLLNLKDVSYVDSSGLGELISAYVSVKNAGGILKLVGLTKRVHDLLRLAHADGIFEVHDDEARAVESFA